MSGSVPLAAKPTIGVPGTVPPSFLAMPADVASASYRTTDPKYLHRVVQLLWPIADAYLAQDGLAELNPVYPNLAWNGKATQSLWHKNPLFGAAYSFYTPGQYTTIAGYEAETQGGVYFCGEHTSLDYQGYMEGAAETGALVAAELLDELGVEAPARLQAVLAPKLVLPQACYRAPARQLRRNQRRRDAIALRREGFRPPCTRTP